MEPVTADQLPQVAELDRQVTGTNRDRLIVYLYRQWPEAMRVVRADGKLAGYATLRRGPRNPDRAGGCIDPAIGMALFDAALQSCARQRVFIDIPVDNTAASQWAKSNGLLVQRPWMRMRRGQPVGDQPANSGPAPGPRTDEGVSA